MTEQTESTVSGKTVLHYPDQNTRTLPNITVDTYTKVINIVHHFFSQVAHNEPFKTISYDRKCQPKFKFYVFKSSNVVNLI